MKINNEIKLLPAGILPIKWVHGNISGSGTEELHFRTLEEKELR